MVIEMKISDILIFVFVQERLLRLFVKGVYRDLRHGDHTLAKIRHGRQLLVVGLSCLKVEEDAVDFLSILGILEALLVLFDSDWR